MNETEFKIKTEIIRDSFQDTRTIKCATPEHIRKLDDDVYKGGDIFTTEDGEFIDLEFQLVDFDEIELAKYVEFAENLYEKHHKHVSVYLICPKSINVLVKECVIKSESDFTIKLYCSQEDPCQMILDGIKHKIKHGEYITQEDIHALAMLPVMCDKKDRNYFRIEYFRIINKLL